MERRDFLKLLSASMLLVPDAALSNQRHHRDFKSLGSNRRELPMQRFNALLLERQGTKLHMDISKPRDYFAACYLLRDVLANQPARAHPLLLHTAALLQAMVAKSHSHEPLIVTSGYRTQATNKKVGGAAHSYHMKDQFNFFKAMDFHMKNTPISVLANYALTVRQGGVGIYKNKDFLHIDVGDPRIWVDV